MMNMDLYETLEREEYYKNHPEEKPKTYVYVLRQNEKILGVFGTKILAIENIKGKENCQIEKIEYIHH